jgi:hypothetical protein
MDNTDGLFNCKICKKSYSSYKSLWNHNKKFHDEHVTDCNITVTDCNINVTDFNKKYNCKFCDKLLKCRQNKYSHEKICKNKNTLIIKSQEENLIQQQINELKSQFALLVKEKGRIHPKTLQKINKQMNNINNGTIINNTYVAFPSLDYTKIFSGSEIRGILNKQYSSLEESIKKVHFNKDIPEYSNLFITNMRDDLAYVFNGKEFIAVKKHAMLNELIDIHSNEINISLEKYRNKLNEGVITRLEKFLEKLNDNYTKITDYDSDKTFSNYKAYKIDSIKLMIYNESDNKKLELLRTMKLEEKTYDENESED